MSEIEQFIALEKQLKPYKKILGQAADVILDQHVSKYPIFVVHQQEIAVGIQLIEADKNLPWSVNASTLEEFVTKNIIFMEKSQDFIAGYKNPETNLCLFVLSELGAQFIYMQR
ncbi:MAG TPA: hypothetical protein PK611_03675 [Saprospiraceae bacterium]|jgi:hypothetical protein|nr:hypothetical protein [Saprospiraceae bacterium]HRO09822.1 hypothetical protein [Saprospiraceae bacterium]HRO72747.1 hypothetical protein [Saprospiraceae bacterium]HRP43017.1 hypothetical protein [Saprospiraceae bacterium]